MSFEFVAMLVAGVIAWVGGFAFGRTRGERRERRRALLAMDVAYAAVGAEKASGVRLRIAWQLALEGATREDLDDAEKWQLREPGPSAPARKGALP